jgi:two-component system, response regulator PdtaR
MQRGGGCYAGTVKYSMPSVPSPGASVAGTSNVDPLVILLVEDNADLRELAAAYLQEVGFEVIATGSAQEAIDVIDSYSRIDLVFSDITMPGAMDGVGLARWLSVNRPLMPLILTSGERRTGFERPTPRRRFLPKPYLFDVVEHDIRELVESASIH